MLKTGGCSYFLEKNTEENVINETAKADTVYKNMALRKEIIDRRMDGNKKHEETQMYLVTVLIEMITSLQPAFILAPAR